MGGREREFVEEAFRTNWISPVGPNIDNFERDLEIYLGENVFVTALSSGTAALHLALIVLGVGPGDEVICPTFTFAASANPIVYVGADPVFTDSENDTWNMDPELLEQAIQERINKGKRIGAVILVHLYGMPARIHDILAITKKYNIPIIEDAAEALGSAMDGRKAGTFGDISVLSFNGNKIITTSGGGALVSQKKEFTEKAKFLASQARDDAPHYQHSEIGYNYRLSNICAGIGRGQMEVLTERVMSRRKVFEQYRFHLADFPQIGFQVPEESGYYSNRWLTAILFPGERLPGKVREALDNLNIESRPLWKPLHLQPVFSQFACYGGASSEKLFKRGLCLPSGSGLRDEQIELICKTVKMSV